MIVVGIQIVTFIIYLIFIELKFGPLPSISESAYKYSTSSGRLWFSLFCAILGVTQMAEFSSLYFLSGAGFIFTGATIDFKEDLPKKVHYSGAASGIIFAFIQLFIDGLWFTAIPIVICIIACYRKSRMIYWVEVVSAIMIIVGKLILIWR